MSCSLTTTSGRSTRCRTPTSTTPSCGPRRCRRRRRSRRRSRRPPPRRRPRPTPRALMRMTLASVTHTFILEGSRPLTFPPWRRPTRRGHSSSIPRGWSPCRTTSPCPSPSLHDGFSRHLMRSVRRPSRPAALSRPRRPSLRVTRATRATPSSTWPRPTAHCRQPLRRII